MGYFNREIRRFGTRCINTYEGIAITLREEASFAQWIAVLLNTGIEAAIDRISDEIHPLSKKAKDCGCAAVALMAFTGLVAWLMVFFT